MQAHVRNIKTIRAELPHGECLFNEDGSATERPLGGFLEGLRDAAKALEKAYGNADNGNARLVGEAFHAPQTVRILASHAYNNLDKAVAVNVAQKVSFKCKLAKGKYTFSVSATDAAGNPSSNTAVNKLTVK